MEWMLLPRRVKMAARAGKILLTAPAFMDMESKERPRILSGQIHHLRFHQCSARPGIKADGTAKAGCICTAVKHSPCVRARAQNFRNTLSMLHQLQSAHSSPFHMPLQAILCPERCFGSRRYRPEWKTAALSKLRRSTFTLHYTLGISIPYFFKLASCSSPVFA